MSEDKDDGYRIRDPEKLAWNIWAHWLSHAKRGMPKEATAAFEDAVKWALGVLNIDSNTIEEPTEGVQAEPRSPVEAFLRAARAKGWSVAVHNDYKIDGKPHTFWLFTHPDGRYAKGEGETDAEALSGVRIAICTEGLVETLRRRESTLFDAIAHGTDKHRAWLKQAIDDHFAGRVVSKP